VILPESAFMERIYDRNRVTILFIVAALGISILIGMITSRSITSPLRNLSGASEAIANGELDSRVLVKGTSEIKVLSRSFNRMAEMLTESFNRLERANAELEIRVQQRTSELADSQLSLQRNNFLLLRREQQMRKQQQVLIEITKNKSLNLGDFMLAVQDITKLASQTLDVERVSIWLFDANKTSLNCLDLYVLSKDLHTEAEMLNAENMPDFFNEIHHKKTFAVEDLQAEPYLVDIERLYFRPLGVVSVIVSCFEVRGDLTGIIMFEHIDVERLWLIEEISFVSSLTDLLILGMEAQERRRAEEGLRIEQVRSERLLLNILPKAIAERLKSSPIHTIKRTANQLWDANSQLHTKSTIIADTFDEVSVLFADIVGFTEFASLVSATELVDMLNAIFSEFDRLADQYELEKIKTIGDSYMVVGGLPLPRADHAEAIADMALEMLGVIHKFMRPDGTSFQLRIGIHTGQAVAGVIGKKKFIYDLWGDTVNIASRMESNALPDCIQVTDVTYQILKVRYVFEQRGSIQVKGKGEMITYWLKERR
jgi:class 3 adenylate cyclase/HAMP domain-containing protein